MVLVSLTSCDVFLINISVLTFLSEGLVSSGLDSTEQFSSLHTAGTHNYNIIKTQ